jgi:23S rRNA A1618 N6-methylase RlmF
MKQATLIAIFIAVVCVGYGRTSNQNLLFGKSYTDTSSAKISGVHEMLQEILSATGLQSNFELKEAKVLNIEASISHRKRYILYNPAFVESLNDLAKNKWAVMALLAHEVGHHLNGHTIRKGGSTPELELEADEFAGFILQKLGATLQQSQNVMNLVAKAKDSSTHPSKSSRLLAIEKGWNRASALEGIKDTAKQ